MKRWIGTLAATALAIAMAGCNETESANGNPESGGLLKKLGKDEKASIKVIYYDKNSFYLQYGNLFMAKFPNIDIEVVSNQSIYAPNKDPQKEMEKLIAEEKPDVLLLQTGDELAKSVAQGQLFPLDDVIKQDKFDVENLLPAVVDTIRAKGDGKLYGLSPDFSGQALYYNKDLFEKYGVPLPTNQMSWQDVLDLAKRFPTDGQGDDRVYGLSAYYNMQDGMGYQLMNEIGTTQGLNYLDPDNFKLTINTDAWKKALELAADSIKSGAMYAPKNENQDPSAHMYEDYLLENPFVAGKAAMALDGNYLLQNLGEAKVRLKDKIKPFNWDMVTVPVDPQNKEYSTSLFVSQIFAINAQSSNPRAAWEFVKYINSDEFARVMSKSPQNLQTRPTYSKERDGHSMEAFYLLKPNPDSPYKGYEKIPSAFFQTFTTLAGEEVKAVVEGKKSADEALQTIQDKGQGALQQAKQEEDAKKAADSGNQPSS